MPADPGPVPVGVAFEHCGQTFVVRSAVDDNGDRHAIFKRVRGRMILFPQCPICGATNEPDAPIGRPQGHA